VFGITPELVALVKKEEGWRSKPYICPAGYPTIGWGHRIPSLNHPEITLARGQQLLQSDLEFKRSSAVRLSPLLAHHEQALAAVIDFCFNLGESRYATSTMRKLIDAEDWKGAAEQMKRWVFYRNPKTKRMEKHASLIRRRAITAGWLEHS
jgi:lysozyme